MPVLLFQLYEEYLGGGAPVTSGALPLPFESKTTVKSGGLPLPYEVAGTLGVGLPFEVLAPVRSGLALPFEVKPGLVSGLLLPFYFTGPVTSGGLPLPFEAAGIDAFSLSFRWNDLQALDAPFLLEWNVADIVFVATLELQWIVRKILATLPLDWRVVPDVFTPFAATVTQPTTTPTTQLLVTSPRAALPFEHNFNPGTRGTWPWESS